MNFLPSFLEQVVEAGPRILRTPWRFLPRSTAPWLEVIAVIGAVLISYPFGLGFVALVVSALAIMPAVQAAMKVGVTLGAGVPSAYALLE